MTDHSQSPATTLPGTLLLRTAGPCQFDPGHLLEVFGTQRRRFTAILDGFGPGDWAAPTRCADWSAHDVARHLCDCTALGVAAGPGDRTLDMAAGYDPRITPGEQLAASAGEPPEATLRRLVAMTDHVLASLRARLAEGRRFDVGLPYGPMDWTVLVLHGFWDSWIHERDVLLPRGTGHPTDGEATAYAVAYGVFLAAAVASMFGNPVREKLTLSGAGGGVFDLDNHGGVVTLTFTPVTTAGPPADRLTDALAGRVPADAVLGDLPASSCAALSRLADFNNTPPDNARREKPS